jgi:hypothetical protein
MKKSNRDALIVFPVLIIIGVLFALAGSQGGRTAAGIPLFALAVGLAGNSGEIAHTFRTYSHSEARKITG